MVTCFSSTATNSKKAFTIKWIAATNQMGGLASKQRISKQEKVGYIKNSPFYLYLTDETLEEFGKCFPFVKQCKEGDEISLDENTIYIIGKGSLELSATMADPSMKIENKGYLCKKRPGDLVSLPKEQDMATEQVCFL